MIPELVSKFAYPVPVKDISPQWVKPKVFNKANGVLAIVDENGDMFAIPTLLWHGEAMPYDEPVRHMFSAELLKKFGDSIEESLRQAGFENGEVWVPWCSPQKSPFAQELRKAIEGRRHRLIKWLFEQEKVKAGLIPMNWTLETFEAI